MNLRKKRMEQGLTQGELANKVGVLNTSICNYESGVREPNLETLKKLASALGCTVDELLRDPQESSDDQSGAAEKTEGIDDKANDHAG